MIYFNRSFLIFFHLVIATMHVDCLWGMQFFAKFNLVKKNNFFNNDSPQENEQQKILVPSRIISSFTTLHDMAACKYDSKCTLPYFVEFPFATTIGEFTYEQEDFNVIFDIVSSLQNTNRTEKYTSNYFVPDLVSLFTLADYLGANDDIMCHLNNIYLLSLKKIDHIGDEGQKHKAYESFLKTYSFIKNQFDQ